MRKGVFFRHLTGYNARMETKRNALFFSVGALLVVAVIFLIFYFSSSGAPQEQTGDLDNGYSVDVDGNATITEYEEVTPIAPDFTKALTFKAGVQPEEKTTLETRYKQIQDFLTQNPISFDGWINLGIIQKAAGDYQGANDSWSYVTKIYPQSTVAFDNLGDLYMNFTKDYPKAEANFKASLNVNPSNIHAYQQLFSLYTLYGYKADTSAAADLLVQGLKANPNNQTLLQLQQELQK